MLPKYDPSVTYILEFCTLLATRDGETIAKMGKAVFDTLQGVLRDSSQYHAITVSRATFYALKLLKASYVSLKSQAEVVAQSLISMRRTMISPMYHSYSTRSQASLKMH